MTMRLNGKANVNEILFEAFKVGADVKAVDFRQTSGETFVDAETVRERNLLSRFGFKATEIGS